MLRKFLDNLIRDLRQLQRGVPEDMLYSSDVWLLKAIHCAARGEAADLVDVIAWGDIINHAIFEHEELDGGLARLASAGWIEPTGPSFRLSAKAKAALHEISSTDWVKQASAIDAGLLGSEVHPWSVPAPPIDPTLTWGLTADVVAEAYKAYRESFRDKRGFLPLWKSDP
jgi:hypothetical protein